VNKISVFSKTGKGLLQLKYRSHRLPHDQLRVLSLIDGKNTTRDLAFGSRMNETDLHNALTALIDSGYIREVAIPVAPVDSESATSRSAHTTETDLDFTHDPTVTGNTFERDR
jgi:hypothetical protein